MRIVIAGASGYIGSAIARLLSIKGMRSISARSPSNGEAWNAPQVSYEVTEFGALLFDPYQISISFPFGSL